MEKKLQPLLFLQKEQSLFNIIQNLLSKWKSDGIINQPDRKNGYRNISQTEKMVHSFMEIVVQYRYVYNNPEILKTCR